MRCAAIKLNWFDLKVFFLYIIVKLILNFYLNIYNYIDNIEQKHTLPFFLQSIRTTHGNRSCCMLEVILKGVKIWMQPRSLSAAGEAGWRCGAAVPHTYIHTYMGQVQQQKRWNKRAHTEKKTKLCIMQLGKSRPTDRQADRSTCKEREEERGTYTYTWSHSCCSVAISVAAFQGPCKWQQNPLVPHPSWSRLDAPLAHKRVASCNFISPAPAPSPSSSASWQVA